MSGNRFENNQFVIIANRGERVQVKKWLGDEKQYLVLRKNGSYTTVKPSNVKNVS